MSLSCYVVPMPYKDLEKKREQSRKWAAKWRAEHPEEAREKARKDAAKFRTKNPEKVLETNRNWYAKNKEHAREAQHRRTEKWKTRNPNGPKEAHKRWAKAHPEQYKKIHQLAGIRRRCLNVNARGNFNSDQLDARIALFGSCCAYCGGPYQHLDHVISLSKGGTNWPANLRPACKTCNTRKNNGDWRKWKVRL